MAAKMRHYDYVVAGSSDLARQTCMQLLQRGIDSSSILCLCPSKDHAECHYDLLQSKPTDTAEWYEDSGIAAEYDCYGWTFDSEAKVVNISEDKTVQFDKLIVAYDDIWSSSSSLQLEIAGRVDPEYVFNIDSCIARSRLREKVDESRKSQELLHVVFYMTTLEVLRFASSALAWPCASVTVINPRSGFQPDLLPQEVLDFLVVQFKSQGVRFHLGKKISALNKDGLQLEEGKSLACDALIIGGVEPIPPALDDLPTVMDASGVVAIKVDKDWSVGSSDVHVVGKSAAWVTEVSKEHVVTPTADMGQLSLLHAMEQMFEEHKAPFRPLLHYKGRYLDHLGAPLEWNIFGYTTKTTIEINQEGSSNCSGYFYLKDGRRTPGASQVVGMLLLNAAEGEIADAQSFCERFPVVDDALLSMKFVHECVQANNEEKSPQDISPYFVKIGNRLVDVVASLKLAFGKYSFDSPESACEPCILKDDFRAVTKELYLDDLTEEELEEALLSFPGEKIRYSDFEKWWIS